MKKDLIEQFADLVVGAADPRYLAERTLEVVMSLSNGRSAAVFSREGERMTLFASRGIDRHALDAVEALWESHRDTLQQGEVLYIPDRASDSRLPPPQAGRHPAGFAVVPVLEGQELVALLYLDSRDPHFCSPHDLERLRKLAPIVAKAVGESSAAGDRAMGLDWESYLERTPIEDMERSKLLLLLNRNEWNIARVSRIMGVTRRTIYLKLERYNIPRERVPKTRPRKATA